MRTRAPVVMIHGAFCGGWAFDKFRVPFEQAGFEVSAPTLRHHGGEGSPAVGSTGLADYADDLEEMLSGLSEAPVLIGHSLGGLLAQMIAARRRVRAMVLIAPCAPWGVMPTTLFEMASAQALFLLAGDYWNTALKPDYGVAAAHGLDKLPRAERKSVFDRFVPESGLATFEILHWALDFRRASYVRARQVTCPILCFAGSDDRINPPSTVKRVAERYEGRAVFEELAGHSHWLIGEPGWELVAARALTWLDELLAEPQAVGV